MDKRRGFIIHDELISDLLDSGFDMSDIGELIVAMSAYHRDGEIPEMSKAVKAVFYTKMKKILDEDREKYRARVERNRENGQKGGRPVTEEKPTETHSVFLGFENDENSETETQNNLIAKSKEQRANSIEDSTTVESMSELPSDRPKINYQGVVDEYNTVCVSMPKCTKLTEGRRKAIKARLSEYTSEQIGEVFRKAEKSDFISGRDGKWTNANFDWLMSPSNFIKVLEGNYDNKASPQKQEAPKSTYPSVRNSWNFEGTTVEKLIKQMGGK